MALRRALSEVEGLAQGHGEPFDFAHGASNGAEQRRSTRKKAFSDFTREAFFRVEPW